MNYFVGNAFIYLYIGRYFRITEDEARSTLGDSFEDIEQFWSPLKGGYVGGLDMFHTLHCLVSSTQIASTIV